MIIKASQITSDKKIKSSTIWTWFSEVVTQIDALEEHDAMRRVEEAKASAAERSFEEVVLKCQRAQLLMQNADFAT